MGKGQEQEGEVKLEEMKLKIEKTMEELNSKTLALDAMEVERENLESNNSKVAEEMKFLKEKLSLSECERTSTEEKWQTEMMEKDAVIEDLHKQIKERETTIQH